VTTPETPGRTSRTEFATDEIAKAIFVGDFRPGQQLTEEELARRFNVSRIPIREALRELSRERLIQLIPAEARS
jgi:DNA-binding GntR family transcriptional regulator